MVSAEPVAGREVHVYLDRTRDPGRNLVHEEELFRWLENRDIPESVRFWVNSECLVKGKAKSSRYGWYHEELAKKMKVRVFGRSTGGGVVFHDDGNLNWSFFLKTAEAFVSPTEMFNQASGYVVKALERLGVAARFSPPNRIDVEGCKVSGMAARSTPHTFLVHGTLLLNTNLEKLNMLCIPPVGSPPVANIREWVTDIDVPMVVTAMVEVLNDSGFRVRMTDSGH